MRKIITIAIFIAVITIILPTVYGKVAAAVLKFDQTSYTVNTGETFNAAVVVDPGTENILGSDAYILYDNTLLEAISVSNGTYFDSVVNSLTTAGKAYIAGLVDDPGTSKTGVGTIATITFKALKAGTGTLSYDCRAGASDASKIVKNDIDATNIIDCAGNGTATVAAGGDSATSSATLTPTPTSTGGGSTGSTGGTTTPAELPKTGTFDNILKYSLPGLMLVLLGGVIKLFLL